MKTLALEFSTEHRSVALCDGASVKGTASEIGGRTTLAFGMIERALAEAQWEREQIECIAVSIGPGSYSGIRVAIAIAQGWQLARNVKLQGIGSLECLARECSAAAISGAVHIIVDAQRNEFYLAPYEINAAGFRETAPVKLATRDEVLAVAKSGGVLAGPGASKWFDAARDFFPTAGSLGLVAAARSDYLPGEKLEPIYLREVSFVKAPSPRILPA